MNGGLVQGGETYRTPRNWSEGGAKGEADFADTVLSLATTAKVRIQARVFETSVVRVVLPITRGTAGLDT